MTQFVEENFEEPGTELEECQLEEWKPIPPKLEKIKDKTLKTWALHLHEIWKGLCRKVLDEIVFVILISNSTDFENYRRQSFTAYSDRKT